MVEKSTDASEKQKGLEREIKQLSLGISGILLRTTVLKHECAQDHLEGLLKHKRLALTLLFQFRCRVKPGNLHFQHFSR